MTTIGRAQTFNIVPVLNYHFLKQINVDESALTGYYTGAIYKLKENNWKLISGGQSISIGGMGQMNYKRFYLVLETAYCLNMYQYSVFRVTAGQEEQLSFKAFYQQIDLPLYLGYQFKSSNFVRYSVFGGIMFSKPIRYTENFFEGGDSLTEHDKYDLNYVIFFNDEYLNSIVGFAVHVANITKIDIRYIHRLKSSSDIYNVKFSTIGFAFTFNLSNKWKKKIYREE